MKKLLSFVMALALMLALAVPALAKSDPKVGASCTGTEAVTVTGAYFSGMAVAVAICDGAGNTVAFQTAAVDGGAFTVSFTGLSLSRGATYTAKAAKYDGGTWYTAEFTVPAAPVPPAGSGCTLTFATNGGSAIEALSAALGTEVDLTKYRPVREGYVFTGWFADEGLTKAVTALTLAGDASVYAGWRWSSPFTDLESGAWYFDDVAYICLNGLFRGVSDSRFEPETAMTRAMLVTVLWRMEEQPVPVGESGFEDLTADWYRDAVSWAARNGLIKGVDDRHFAPNDPITREQMAAALYNYARFKNIDVSVGENTNILSYADAENVSEYAIPAMQWACGAGLVQGDGGKLLPLDEATRAETAALLHRFCDSLVK